MAERNYCVTRCELTAVIFALKVFRPYLLRRQFDVQVDNKAVSFLIHGQEPDWTDSQVHGIFGRLQVHFDTQKGAFERKC